MKLLLPAVLAAALLPGAPAHAAPKNPFKIVKRTVGSPGDTVLTGRRSGFSFWLSGQSMGRRVSAYRWDGAKWRPSTLPDGLAGANPSVDAAASGPSDVWATVTTGTMDDDTRRTTLIRWNGKRWSVAKRFKNTDLDTIAVLGRTDVWAFGTREPGGKPLAMHFDGRRWTSKVLGRSSPDVVGSGAGRIWGTESGRLFRWTGGTWRRVALPAAAGVVTSLHVTGGRITLSTATHVVSGGEIKSTLHVVTGTGGRWRVETPKAAKGLVPQSAVRAPDGGVWALGFARDDSQRLLHRSARGRWTSRRLPTTFSYYDLTPLPGTARLVAVADRWIGEKNVGAIVETR